MKIVIEIPEAYEYAFKGGDHLSYTLARVSGDIMKLGFHECGPYEKGIVEMLREALEHCEPLPDQTRGTRLEKEEDDGAVFTFDRANVSPDVIALIEDAEREEAALLAGEWEPEEEKEEDDGID